MEIRRWDGGNGCVRGCIRVILGVIYVCKRERWAVQC
jgi:hypothetical protein